MELQYFPTKIDLLERDTKLFRRTGLEAELRARAVAEETLAKTVGVLREGK